MKINLPLWVQLRQAKIGISDIKLIITPVYTIVQSRDQAHITLYINRVPGTKWGLSEISGTISLGSSNFKKYVKIDFLKEK